MSARDKKSPEDLDDLTPESTDAQDAGDVKGGFNPQPEPPGRPNASINPFFVPPVTPDRQF